MRHAVITGLGPMALAPILGRSAFQRHLFHLARIGVERVTVQLSPAADAAGPMDGTAEDVCRRQRAGLPGAPPTLEFGGGTGGEGPLLRVRAAAVFDPRLYDAAAAAAGPVVLVDIPGEEVDIPGEEVDIPGEEPEEPEDRGRGGATAEIGIERLDPGADAAPAAGRDPGNARRLNIATLPAYIPALRREIRPWWLHLERPEDLRAAGRRLLDATQKGVLDFPARYLHPIPENALTRWLAPGRVTPNQITAATGILGFGSAGLFAAGRFGAALALALLVNVLDGVDGKLARVKLLTSRFGDRLDHTLDVSFEFAWYAALGWGLGRLTGEAWPLPAGLALIVAMLGCRGASGLYRLRTGRQIHDHTAFDRAVRLVAGRRNIYVLLLAGGWALDAVPSAFRLTLGWAAATLAVYLVRVAIAFATDVPGAGQGSVPGAGQGSVPGAGQGSGGAGA